MGSPVVVRGLIELLEVDGGVIWWIKVSGSIAIDAIDISCPSQKEKRVRFGQVRIRKEKKITASRTGPAENSLG